MNKQYYKFNKTFSSASVALVVDTSNSVLTETTKINKQLPFFVIINNKTKTLEPFVHNSIAMDFNETITVNNLQLEKEYFLNDLFLNNLKKIDDIARLPNNWNGNGATSFSNQLIDKLRQIVVSVKRQPEIFPTGCNSIQIEYDGSKNSYLEIEIKDEDVASVFKINQAGNESNFEINSNPSEINKIVDEFYES